MDKFSIFRTTVLSAIFVLVQPHEARAEGKFVPFKYGDFDTWVTRQIHESAVIGGNPSWGMMALLGNSYLVLIISEIITLTYK